MRSPAFVAEISGNHLGTQRRAEALVDLAAVAGADAVKFQTYDPKRMVGDPRIVLESGPWAGRKLIDLYQEAWTPKTWQPDLFAQARKLGLVPFSSPFSREDVDFLEGIKCPIYKIASFEITDLDLISYAAQTKKPMVISTGMATLMEIEYAVDQALSRGAPELTILKCTSGYPTPINEANLATIFDLHEYFGDDPRISFGLSDHTRGGAAAVAAVALGAVMIEKHLTISRADGGPDAEFSAESHEFARMVNAGREVALALGNVHYGPSPSEAPQLLLRRSLWVVKDMAEGEPFTRDNLRACRPGRGVALLPIGEFLGKRAKRTVKAGTQFDPCLATAV